MRQAGVRPTVGPGVGRGVPLGPAVLAVVVVGAVAEVQGVVGGLPPSEGERGWGTTRGGRGEERNSQEDSTPTASGPDLDLRMFGERHEDKSYSPRAFYFLLSSHSHYSKSRDPVVPSSVASVDLRRFESGTIPETPLQTPKDPPRSHPVDSPNPSPTDGLPYLYQGIKLLSW